MLGRNRKSLSQSSRRSVRWAIEIFVHSYDSRHGYENGCGANKSDGFFGDFESGVGENGSVRAASEV